MKKKITLAALACAAVLVVGIMAFIFWPRAQEGALGGLQVFYLNASDGRLQPVNVTIGGGSAVSQIDALVARFYNPPSALTGLWPAGMPIVGLAFYDGVAGVALPPEYRALSAVDEALFRVGLTLTLLELPFVERVLFWVAGEGEYPYLPLDEVVRSEPYWAALAARVETAYTIDNNPSISPGVMQARTLTLYFVCADGYGLITETYTDEYIDIHRLAEIMLNHLIMGPATENALRLIPPETRVRHVNAEVVGVRRSLYIDLSGDFMSRFIGTQAQARLMLQSIVNTLTLPANQRDVLNRIYEVFFLIDSQRYETFHGVANFHMYFTYDHAITLVDEVDAHYAYAVYEE